MLTLREKYHVRPTSGLSQAVLKMRRIRDAADSQQVNPERAGKERIRGMQNDRERERERHSERERERDRASKIKVRNKQKR